jgi:hypothetical protein
MDLISKIACVLSEVTTQGGNLRAFVRVRFSHMHTAPFLPQDCPGNCSHAGACMLWHGAPRGWYNDGNADVPEAPAPATDLASKNTSSPKADDSLAQRAAKATASSEYPQCVCFPGLGVSFVISKLCYLYPVHMRLCIALTNCRSCF